MSFWAVEVTPNKVFTTTPAFDLHVSQIVLPAGASDKGRTVLQCKVGDKSFSLGSLKLDLQENVHTDLIFDANTEIQLTVTGNNNVQVLGYYVDNGPTGLSDDEDDEDDEGMPFGLGDEDDDEEIDEDEFDEDELTGATLQALTKRKAGDQLTNGAKKAKVAEKPKAEHQQQKDEQKPQQPKGEQKPQQPKGEQKPQQPKGEQKPQQPKGEQKPQQPKGEQKPQQPKGEQKPQQPKGEQKDEQKPKGEKKQKGEQKQQKGQQGQEKVQQEKVQQEKRPQTPGKEQKSEGAQKVELIEGKRRVVDGVAIRTIKIGLGAQAKLGSKVRVMYVGRLQSGKVFDKSVKPFEFVLGVGQVIKGWDTGIMGMRVGETRRLVIPPQHAYGRKGMPPVIPGDSTLDFSVELLKV